MRSSIGSVVSPSQGRRFPRRRLLQDLVAASGALIVGFDPLARSWITAANAEDRKLEELPSLDGRLQLDDPTRDFFSFDYGRNVQRVPLAVLRPGSVDDVVKMIRFANEGHLKSAMRGQGHSLYGQTLVEAGIVIDSGTLRAVRLVSADSVDVQPGATWSEVSQVTLNAGRTAPVLPDTMTQITVGGILSVGGFGETSHRFGAIVDTIQELDVVTGDGRLVTCSPQQERELFEMVLAGLGQCGLIVRARVRLVSAPSHVIRQVLSYDDLDVYLSDAALLALDERFDYLHGSAVQTPSGGWSFRMSVGTSYTPPQVPDLAAKVSGLSFNLKAEPTRVSYWDYLLRNVARNRGDRASAAIDPNLRRAFIMMFVSESTAKDFVAKTLATPGETAGRLLPEIFIQPHSVRKLTRPLLKTPNEDVAFSLRIIRGATAGTTAYSEVMDSNRAMLERMRAIGGKRYTPYSMYLTPTDWEEHFGPAAWRRLTAAKKKYDPNNVLTPGPGISA